MPILAVGAAGVVFAALMCYLLFMAAAQFGRVVANILPDWHIPGFSSLRGWVADRVSGISGFVLGAFGDVIRALVNTITHPVVFFTKMYGSIIGMGVELYNASRNIVRVAMPFVVRGLTGLINYVERQLLSVIASTRAALSAAIASALTRALHYADVVKASLTGLISYVYVQAVKYADAIRGWAAATIATALAQAVHYAQTLAGIVSGQAVSLFHQAIGYADALSAQALGYAKGLYDQAIHYADAAAHAAATTAISALNGALITDIAHVWPAITTTIDDVIDVAGEGFTDVVDDLRGISKAVPRTIPAAIAGLAALSLATARLAKDCTIPNCRNLSGFGNELQALIGIAEDGALIALVAAAIADPEGTAHEVVSVFGGVVSGAASLFEDAVGV